MKTTITLNRFCLNIRHFKNLGLLIALGTSVNVVAQLPGPPTISLSEYVKQCKADVGFQSLPDINCNDGEKFGFSGGAPDPTNDFFGYHKINDNVDLAFACRWLTGTRDGFTGSFPNAFSAEMFVHNRDKGSTCFFSAIEKPAGNGSVEQHVPALIKSPTSSQADKFWHQPAEMDKQARCVGCHAAGPYIASERIAPFLAKYGLLNNTHDTFNNSDPGKGRYHAATSNFALWNKIIKDTTSPSCAAGCHYLATKSTQKTISRASSNGPFTLLPSISDVIKTINSQHQVMPPLDPHSHYRWINMDSLSGGVDREDFVEAKLFFTDLLGNCDAPKLLEARTVGSDYFFSTAEKLPDTLAFFNAKEGLQCVDAAQSDGKCADYEVRYLCPGKLGSKNYWTQEYKEKWYDLDNPGPTMDNESRQGLAQNGITLCDGKEPLSIQARATENGTVHTAFGPHDRLYRFDAEGLTCRNQDQPGKQCSNYVVRYKNCAQDNVAKSNFYEIAVQASNLHRPYGNYRIYVDGILLTSFDRAIGFEGFSSLQEHVFRTNATGEITVKANNKIQIRRLSVNGRERLVEGEVDPFETINLVLSGKVGGEIVRLVIGGREIARYTLKAGNNYYTTQTQVFGELKLEFMNSGSGRSVEVVSVEFNGVFRKAEEQSNNTATMVNGRCGGGKGKIMNCNGAISFGELVNDIEFPNEGYEYTFGQVANRATPKVVTIVDEFMSWSTGYCASLVVQNTTAQTQNVKYNFEVTKGKIYSATNFKASATSGVITGTIADGMQKTLAPYERGDWPSVYFCVQTDL